MSWAFRGVGALSNTQQGGLWAGHGLGQVVLVRLRAFLIPVRFERRRVAVKGKG